MNLNFYSLLSVAALALPAMSVAQTERPNVLLIMCDDLMDCQGVYSNATSSITPNLDRLASESTRFTNAHSIAPVSAPCRAALFTGVYPHVSENYGFDNWKKNPVLSNNKTVMEMLVENGYTVLGTGKLLHHNLKTAYSTFGPDHNSGPLAYDGTKVAVHPSVPHEYGKIGPLDGTFASLADVPTVNGYTGWWDHKKNKPFRYVNDDDRSPMGDEVLRDWAVKKIEELSNREAGDNAPFYLGVGFSKPHTSLVAPQKYFDMHPLESVKLPDWIEGDADDTFLFQESPKLKGFKHFEALKKAYGEDIREGVRRYLQAYLACMSFVDEQIGAVLDALDKSPLADNTIVIFVSDHGYDFGQKEYFFKNSLWATSTNVPFIVRLPKSKAAVNNAPVSLIDIYPTIVDYCSLEGSNVKSEAGGALGGHSLRELLESPKLNERSDAPIAVSVLKNKDGEVKASHLQNYAVNDAKWRYIHYASGDEELYDKESDPYEITNLAKDKRYKAIKAELYAKLAAVVPGL